MLNTYIKNRGTTKTIIHNNNHNKVHSINWDADYDGDVAHISLDTNVNGRNNHLDISLDNEDLAKILNMQSVDIPIDKRLQMDFQNEPTYINPGSIEDLLPTRISSPLPNEELIIPLKLDNKAHNKYTLTPRKRHKRRKTHTTHKVYKKPKSKTKRKTVSKLNTLSMIDLF